MTWNRLVNEPAGRRADELMRDSVQCGRIGQREFGHQGIERTGVFSHAEKGAFHGALWRADLRPAGVFKLLAGLQQGLVPDHRQAAHLLYMPSVVRDHPAPGYQLGGHGSGVANGDGVRIGVAVLGSVGLLRQRAYSDSSSEFGS